MSKHSSKCKHTSNRHLCDVLELSAYFLKVGLKLKLRYSIFFPIKWLLELETFSGRTWFCPPLIGSLDCCHLRLVRSRTERNLGVFDNQLSFSTHILTTAWLWLAVYNTIGKSDPSI